MTGPGGVHRRAESNADGVTDACAQAAAAECERDDAAAVWMRADSDGAYEAGDFFRAFRCGAYADGCGASSELAAAVQLQGRVARAGRGMTVSGATVTVPACRDGVSRRSAAWEAGRDKGGPHQVSGGGE